MQCASVKYGSACVSACPAGFQADAANVCGACDVECVDTCLSPGDPSRCVACKNYRDAGSCSATCPASKVFVDGNKNCLSACPLAYPFFNDTALVAGGVPTMPQLCVASCILLSSLHSSNPSNVYRCSLPSQMPSASTASTSSISGPIIAAIVVGGLILVAIAILIVHRRNRNTIHSMPSFSSHPSKRYLAPIDDDDVFDPTGVVGEEGTFDPRPAMTTSFVGHTHPHRMSLSSYAESDTDGHRQSESTRL
jgi:hypothetical protein